MGEFYMGTELGAVELPANQPAPAHTPPEGVILVRTAPDGWTRKYLYHADRMGRKEELLIAEIPPQKDRSIPLAGPSAPPPQARMPDPAPAAIPFTGPRMIPAARSGPLGTPIRTNSPFMGQGTARLAQAPQPPAAPPAGLPQPPGGQAPPEAPPGLPAPLPGCSICPGPMQLADGKTVHLDDPITLSDLCQMLPYFLQCAPAQAPGKAQGPSLAPGAVPVVGGPGQPVPGAGFPSFGPAAGGWGGGGFGGGGGGGTPGFGPVGIVSGQNTPMPLGPGQGPPGPPGPPGAAGAAQIDFIVKTDGNFGVGPGGFIPVPGTLLSFSTAADGPAVFFVQAVIGCDSNNTQLGLRIDGVDQPLNIRVIHTFAGGVADFLMGQAASWPMALLAGAHTVELVIRGASSGALCAGTGLPFAGEVQANPDVPLAITVFHR